MSISKAELQDAASKAFGGDDFAVDAEKSWNLITEMGWLMISVPEEQGGLGLDTVAEAVIYTELGRALVPGPFIAQMLAIEALIVAEKFAERDDLLEGAIGGKMITASLAKPEENTVLHCVPDADKANYILRRSDKLIELVPLAKCLITQQKTWDKSRRLYDVEISETDAITLAQGEAAKALNNRLTKKLLIALAGDALGGANAILEKTLEYLKTRYQFDRPLAMFQTLKHRTADMKTQLSAAEALFWMRASGNPSLAELGALKAHCTSLYQWVAEEAIQLHGGIGLTDEYYCHLFLKRAFLNCALAGDADYWEELAGRQRLTDLLN